MNFIKKLKYLLFKNVSDSLCEHTIDNNSEEVSYILNNFEYRPIEHNRAYMLTAFYHACQQQYIKLISLFIKAGAKLEDCYEVLGRNLLLEAVKTNNKELVDFYLDNKIDPNYRNYPIIVDAYMNPNVEIIESLLKAGANPNAIKGDKNALSYLYTEIPQYNEATDQCESIYPNYDKKCAKLFFQYGGNPNGKTYNYSNVGATPMHFELMLKHDDIIELLIVKGFKPLNSYPSTLEIAIKAGNLKMAEYCVNHGTELNMISDQMILNVLNNGNDWTSLLISFYQMGVTFGRFHTKQPRTSSSPTFNSIEDIAKCFGTNIDSLLQQAIDNKKNRVAIQILNEMTDRTKKATYLLYGIKHSNVEVVTYLLNNGVNPDGLDNDPRNSPLAKAMTSKNLTMVKLLIDHGANIYKPKILGKNIYEFAVYRCPKDIQEYILKKLAEP